MTNSQAIMEAIELGNNPLIMINRIKVSNLSTFLTTTDYSLIKKLSWNTTQHP